VCHLHINPAFAEQDLNSVLPTERLHELAELGETLRPSARAWARLVGHRKHDSTAPLSRFSERVDREAQAIAALNHPNIRHLYRISLFHRKLRPCRFALVKYSQASLRVSAVFWSSPLSYVTFVDAVR